jgi:hypothetical protein
MVQEKRRGVKKQSSHDLCSLAASLAKRVSEYH